MLYVTTISGWDFFELVQMTATVRKYPEDISDASNTVFECTTRFPGTGETDPREWLRDALIALLEEI